VKIFNHLSVKWKIYLIAIISIIGFGGYLGFNVWVNSQNAHLLESLRRVSFPVLEKTNANRVRLDRLSELFNSAVQTGESEYIDSAVDTAKKINDVFAEILVLTPHKQPQIDEITKDFNTYFNLAKKVASDMSSGTDNLTQEDMDALMAQVEQKEVVLKDLIAHLDVLIRESDDTFSGNINTANANSKKLLTSGFVIWAVSILVLAITVYAIARIILKNINSVSDSLHEIAHGGGDFSKQITVSSNDEIGKLASSFNELMDNLREKTNDLMSMMQNMHQGLITINDDETIHQEYAAYVEEIFDTKQVAGKNYTDLLFAGANLGSDTLNQIKVAVSSLLGSDEMMFEFNRHLLVKEYSIDKKIGDQAIHKIIELDWDPILSDGVIHKIMVTARDVTELKSMQAAAEGQKKELQIIGQILKASPSKFDRFAENAHKLLDKNEALIKENNIKDVRTVADLFVNMHTIKGNARTYNFSYITDPVHEAENVYDRLRKETEYPWNPQALLTDLNLVRDAVNQYCQIKTDKLSFSDKEAASNKDVVAIPKANFAALIADFESMIQAPTVSLEKIQTLLSRVKTFDSIPFIQVIGELIDSLPSLAKQLEKEPPQVNDTTNRLFIRSEFANMINDVATHLLRNCVDHGIESPAERIAKQKPARGIINIAAEMSTEGAAILLWDDGKGLNLKRIKEKAIEAKHLSEADLQNPQKIAECLFLSGVSTAEKITAISGRGVGMDAVRQYLQQNGCNIKLQLAEGASANDDFVPFTLKIALHKNIYEIADV
jgi:two-component system, chemotaxis family, sensor kinase CheA